MCGVPPVPPPVHDEEELVALQMKLKSFGLKLARGGFSGQFDQSARTEGRDGREEQDVETEVLH